MTTRRNCRHDNLRGIYGDEIIAAGYKRSQCLDCGKLFDDLPPESEYVAIKGYCAFREEWNEEERIVVYDRLNGALQAARNNEPMPLYIKVSNV